MMWQDIVITIVNMIFVYALVPQVYKGFKDKKEYITFQTGLLTSLGMIVLTITYFTLNLFFSTIVVGIAGLLWLTLFIQGIIYNK